MSPSSAIELATHRCLKWHDGTVSMNKSIYSELSDLLFTSMMELGCLIGIQIPLDIWLAFRGEFKISGLLDVFSERACSDIVGTGT